MPYLGVFEAGSDWDFRLTVQDEDGAAIDLSGGSAIASVRKMPRGGYYLIADTCSFESDGSDGVVVEAVSDTESTKFPAGGYELIVVGTTAGGIKRSARGTFTVAR